VLGKKRIILLAIEDITERKQVEALKEQALAYVESIINTVRDPLLALDQDLRVVTASQAFYEVFKVSSQETIGQFIYDLGNKQWDIPKLRDLLETILPEKTTFDNYELEHNFSTIGKRTMLLNARQIDEVLGKKRIILLAIEDITERKEAEEVIAKLDKGLKQRAQELEAANKELEAFSYSISHDLRAPLRHIDGFIGILRKSSADKLDAKGLHQLNVISDSAKQMGNLIDALLFFSRIGRVVMEKNFVNANKIVQSVVSDLQPDIKDRDIEWKLGTLPPMEGDPSMLKQVFANLIQNAVKYTGNRLKAIIEVGSTDAENGEDEFFVRDNGAGFDMQYVGNLYGVFQRLHTIEEFEGTGIGLANVRRIITRHGGRTWAEGIVDNGATFYFSLPKPEVRKS